MTTDKPRHSEEEVFAVARLIPTPAGRQQYLNQVCADDAETRRDVEELLAIYECDRHFLESPPPELNDSSGQKEVITETPGQAIGPYKLIEQIGEGGMGVVYMAEQTVPVRRKVALKIVKPGMDSKEVVARFDAERQALAMMNHPNVAKVLDGGATESGRPYFVMELVRGIPVTEFCDRQKLSVDCRLELFISICQAVHHAHLRGIIHRDIKPTNILVELHDVEAVPKVIDFGVAKAVTQQLTEHSLHTGFSQIIGTPLYMSPEQAELSGLDVDTRTDIYSLGVLLYELLSGTTPFQHETLKKAGYDEMRRIIREEEPQRPSSRISSLEVETVSTVSAKRGSDPRGLVQSVYGELDWIVMRAMDKDRTRRYDSAGAMATDVQHYLNDEPVIACPPTWTYRMGKFARRNRVSFLLAISAAIILVFGVGALFVSNLLISRERDAANRQRDIAREHLRRSQLERWRESQWVGDLRHKNGALWDAVDAYRGATASIIRMVEEFPDSFQRLEFYGAIYCHRRVVMLLDEIDRSEDAQEYLRDLISKLEKVRLEDQQKMDWIFTLRSQTHLLLGHVLEQSNKPLDAPKQFELALSVGLHGWKNSPGGEISLSEVAIAHFRRRNWRGVETVARTGIEDGDGQPGRTFYFAPLLLFAGQDEEFKTTCRRLLDRASAEEPVDDRDVAALVRLCGLSQDCVGESQRVLNLAERTFANRIGESRPNYEIALARAYYRGGHPKLAIRLLCDDKDRSESNHTERFGRTEAVACLDLAIAHRLAGENEKAEEWLKKSIDLLDGAMNGPFDGYGPNPQDPVSFFETTLLRREAEGRISG